MPVEKSKTSRSLTTTLAVAFLALSVAVLLIASSIEMIFNFQSQQETVAGKQQLIAQGAANTVASFIQEKFSVLETAIKLGDPTSASQEEEKRTLEDLLGFDRAFRQLVLLDSQNQELVKVSRISQAAAEQLMDRVESDLFSQVKQGNRYISSVYIDDLTSEPMVVMAVPATDIFGDFQGTLLAEVNLKFMWDLVDRLEIGQTGQAYVVDREGDLIAFGDISHVLRGDNVSHLKEVGEFISNPASVDVTGASISPGINGTTIMGTYVPLGTPDWAVVTELPVSEAYREVVQGAAISVGVMLVMAMLAGLIGVYVARRLAVPLLDLTGTATQIAEGKVDMEASVEGPTEVNQLASAFNSMTTQLRELIDSLEQRVADRTQRLELLATLGERLSAILDFEQLLTELVNQVKEGFDYYHAHVYILDDNRQNLVMTAGAGQAGVEMKARGHLIPLDAPTSLVARCARTSEIVWVDNVREAEDWLSNPLLPDTYSEMAVPIVLEGQMVGVLDVQEDEIAGLDESDANLLRSLANQVAVAIRNARLFSQTQEALDEAQRLQRLYTGQAWEKFSHLRPTTNYEVRQPTLPPLQEIATPEAMTALQHRQTVDLRIGGRGDDGSDDWSELEEGGLATVDSQTGDVSEESSGLRAGSTEPETVANFENALATPLRLGEEVIGVLGIRDDDPDRRWTVEEIALIEAVSEQMSLAIENARLFEETGRRASRERVIADVTRRIWASGELEQVMRTAVEQLGQTLDASKVIIRLGTEDQLGFKPIEDTADPEIS